MNLALVTDSNSLGFSDFESSSHCACRQSLQIYPKGILKNTPIVGMQIVLRYTVHVYSIHTTGTELRIGENRMIIAFTTHLHYISHEREGL